MQETSGGCGNMIGVTMSDPTADEQRRRLDARMNSAARDEMLRLDGAKSLGENLEQADALIRAAFELAEAFSAAAS